jgi:hypothetical protein
VGTTAKGVGLLRRLAADHFATIEALGQAFLRPVPGRPKRSG